MLPLSIAAGLLQAGSAVFAKLAFSPTSGAAAIAQSTCEDVLATSPLRGSVCNVASLGSRGLLFVTVLVLNSSALALALRGMNQLGSFKGTVLNTATNIVASAMLAWLIFGEPLSLLWWAGATLIAAGVVLLSTQAQAQQKEGGGAPEPAAHQPSSAAASAGAAPSTAPAATRPADAAAAAAAAEPAAAAVASPPSSSGARRRRGASPKRAGMQQQQPPAAADASSGATGSSGTGTGRLEDAVAQLRQRINASDWVKQQEAAAAAEGRQPIFAAADHTR